MKHGQQEVAQSVLAIAGDVNKAEQAGQEPSGAGGRQATRQVGQAAGGALRSSHASQANPTTTNTAKSVSASISWTQRLQHNFPSKGWGNTRGGRVAGRIHKEQQSAQASEGDRRALSEAAGGEEKRRECQ